jgi:hypothetical protein
MSGIVDELLAVAYRHYPKAVWPIRSNHGTSPERQRLVAARIAAGTGEGYARWLAMLDRVGAELPDCAVENWAFHLPAGGFDASYHAKIRLPTIARPVGLHELGVHVSFLVPHYVMYSYRAFFNEKGPDDKLDPNGVRVVGEPVFSFRLSSIEQPRAQVIAEEIEATFCAELMPPEVGKIVVPDVALDTKEPGRATLYDCIFSENFLPESERAPGKP